MFSHMLLGLFKKQVVLICIRELKQATFLTTRTSLSKKAEL